MSLFKHLVERQIPINLIERTKLKFVLDKVPRPKQNPELLSATFTISENDKMPLRDWVDKYVVPACLRLKTQLKAKARRGVVQLKTLPDTPKQKPFVNGKNMEYAVLTSKSGLSLRISYGLELSKSWEDIYGKLPKGNRTMVCIEILTV